MERNRERTRTGKEGREERRTRRERRKSVKKIGRGFMEETISVEAEKALCNNKKRKVGMRVIKKMYSDTERK